MGLASNNGVSSCFTLNSLHSQTLMSTDVQTPFLGTPLVPLRALARAFPPVLPDAPVEENRCQTSSVRQVVPTDPCKTNNTNDNNDNNNDMNDSIKNSNDSSNDNSNHGPPFGWDRPVGRDTFGSP